MTAPFGSPEELRTRPITDLISQLSRELATLVKQELDLAKMELSERGKVMAAAGAFLALGALLSLAAFAAFTASLILAIALALPAWAAALIVAIAYGVVGGILALIGKARLQRAQPPAPQTIETIKENIEWAKTRARSGWK